MANTGGEESDGKQGPELWQTLEADPKRPQTAAVAIPSFRYEV